MYLFSLGINNFNIVYGFFVINVKNGQPREVFSLNISDENLFKMC